MECDNARRSVFFPSPLFQSTHSHGVRPFESSNSTLAGVFQSTHSHGVRPQSRTFAKCAEQISINALAWSATRLSTATSTCKWDFNQRTRMECDGVSAESVVVSFVISINALAWSATIREVDSKEFWGDFNQRTRMECDRIQAELFDVVEHFNQRTRMECDSRFLRSSSSLAYFNQRTRMECDHQKFDKSISQRHFNQRTRMECDSIWDNQTPTNAGFQSTHSHGVRL